MYAFGMYGEALKQTLHLSQSQLNTISSAMFIAGLFSWIPGLIVDRFGSRFSLCLGGLTGALSSLAYWIFARQFVVIQAIVPMLSLLSMLTCLSCAMIVGSVFKIILLTSGPGTKGAAVGVAKAYVGLGAGVYTCIFQAIRRHDQTPLDFLPMSAVFFIVLAFLPGLFLLPTQAQVTKENIVNSITSFHFRVLYMSLLLLAIVVIGSSVADLMEGADEEKMMVIAQEVPNRKYVRAILILTIWLGPIASLLFLTKEECSLSWRRQGEQKRKRQRNIDDEGTDPITAVLFMASPVASSDNMLQAFSSSSGLRRELSSIAASSQNILGLLGPPHHSFTEKFSSAPALFVPPRTGVESEEKTVGNEEASEAHEETFLLADIEGDVPYTQSQPHIQPHAYHYYDDHNYSLLQMLQKPSAWLMLWTCTIVVGSGTLQTNNMGEMVASRHYPEALAPSCLALFSVSQATARVVTGAVSEAALNWKQHHGLCFVDYGIPRPFFLVISSALACVAHLILSFDSTEIVFVVGSVLSGVAFGMAWPLMVLIVGEVFGLDNHGANYMFYE